ncbi:MAG: hypothetical protein IPJ52_04430 [Rhodocyclaceae bacterium]|nr:hypothetical protein [Rhodocyclaceae bacterium]
MRWLLFVALSLLAGAGALFIVLIDAEPLVTPTENLSQVPLPRRGGCSCSTIRAACWPASSAASPCQPHRSTRHQLSGQPRAARPRRAVLGEDSAETRLTLRVPWPAGSANVSSTRAIISESQGEPRIAAAAIGATPIPQWLAEFTLLTTVRAVGYGQEWDMARGAVRRLTFEPRQGSCWSTSSGNRPCSTRCAAWRSMRPNCRVSSTRTGRS